ncbi:MAG: hypothetical protein K6B17_06845 [Treponema sp.]|nr:hypothetical protein [Treponema sp.]
MFKVTGSINEEICTLRYSGGILTGDAVAIEKARKENKKNYGYLGATPSGISKNYLRKELPANDLITRFVFDVVTEEKNDWQEPSPDAIF